MNKTIPMELRYYKHKIYTSLDCVDLVVWFNESNISHFQINPQGEMLFHANNLSSNPLSNKQEDYYYLDHCSIDQLQALEPLRMKFDLSSMISNLNFVKEYLTLDEVSIKDFSMEHANILSDAVSCLQQLYFFCELEGLHKSKEKIDQLMDNYLLFPKQDLNEEIKSVIKNDLNFVIFNLEQLTQES